MSEFLNPDAPIRVDELHNYNVDRTKVYPVMVRGNMWKTSGGSWVYDSKPTSFQISTVELTMALTDYSCLIPQDTKMIQMKVRGLNGSMISCATTSAISANSYFTMVDTQTETIGAPGCNFDEQNFWIAGDTAGTVVELTLYK